MTAASAGAQSSPTACPSCGVPVSRQSHVCAACGRTLSIEAPARLGEADEVAREAIAIPLTSGPQTSAWPAPKPPILSSTYPAAASSAGGIAALASTPAARPASRPLAHRSVLMGISVVCMLALLAGGVYWAYAALLPAPSQTALARYFPDSTVVYAAVDLQQAQGAAGATAFPALSESELSGAFQTLGLNWSTDVQPWAGPQAALGIFAALPATQSSASGAAGALGLLSVAVVLQSRDDNAATRAIQKAIAHEQTPGASYAATASSGYTIYAPTAASSASQVVATGRGIVVLANSLSAAQTVIDQANGGGNNLSGDSAFQQAVSSLPPNRFGTLYYNVSALTDPTGLGVNIVSLPFVSTYPVGAGSLTWTSVGMRWQLNMAPVQRDIPSASLGGDTTSLAALVPADATTYIGVANLGALSRQLGALVSSSKQAGTAQDFLSGVFGSGVFGVPSSAPGTQVPAAAYVEESGPATVTSASATVALLREPTAAAADALMAAIATQHGWTREDSTVDGVPTASYFASSSPSGADGTASTTTSAAPTAPAAVAAYLNGVMVIANSTTALQRVVAVERGQTLSLGQLTTFRQLVAIAPTHPAATVYGSANALGALLPAAPLVGGAASGSSGSGTASLGTLTWTSATLQVTYDVARQ